MSCVLPRPARAVSADTDKFQPQLLRQPIASSRGVRVAASAPRAQPSPAPERALSSGEIFVAGQIVRPDPNWTAAFTRSDSALGRTLQLAAAAVHAEQLGAIAELAVATRFLELLAKLHATLHGPQLLATGVAEGA